MPAFQAINLEPEENIDEQIDTTKELNVDEALKRFQTALKLHAQGPRSREAASAAYQELFDSEIFRYREARTDYERAEAHANGELEPQTLESFSAGLDVDAGGADGVAATLSLTLYLGYKNYGEFFLDKLKDLRDTDPKWKDKLRVLYHRDGGDKVLDNWAKALDQDPSDPEAWRRAARFSAALNSARLKRYCLEAAIELDDDPAVVEIDPPSLAEGLAGEQLKLQLQLLGDQMALSHPILAPWFNKEMPTMIKRHLDPIAFLPDPTQALALAPASAVGESELPEDERAGASSQDGRDTIKTTSSWSDLGAELMKHIENTKAALLTCEAILEASQPDADVSSRPDESEMVEQPEKPMSQDKLVDKDEANAPTGNQGASDEKDEQNPEATAEAQKVADKPLEKPENGRSQSAPTTRKRSQSTAGLPDGLEEDAVPEKRSKRVRRRETGDAGDAGPGTTIATQLQPYQEADHNLFRVTKNILENLGVEDKDTIDRLGELQDSSSLEDRMSKLTPLASKDLRTIVTNFSADAARTLLNKEETASLGLSSFLEYAKSGSQDQATTPPFDESGGFKAFTEKVDQCRSWMTGADIAFEWVRAISKSYAEQKWSDEMKSVVVQMLNRLHAELYGRITEEIKLSKGSTERLEELQTLVPMLLELHIDIYERATNPSSVVDYATRVEAKDRLGRWLNVASAFVQLLDRPPSDPINVRFLWASVMASSHADDPVREHMLLMWTSLRDFLSDEAVGPIALPNNMVMPIVSAEAADREISKLTTMDFFLGLFQDEMENPVHVIETLEPVLNPSSVHVVAQESQSPEGEDSDKESEGRPIAECAGQGLRDLWKFLLSSSTELRLFLWSQLGMAYDAIDYKTKKFSCHLKSIEMIMADLEGETYAKTPDDSRQLLLLRTLKSLDDQLVKALSMALNEPEAFDIIDQDHIKSSTGALAKVSCLLHVVALCEDEIRLGITAGPSSNTTFQSQSTKLREMQVRAWALQYTLINAAIPQQGSFISPDNERADFLAAVHQATGLRKYCKASNKIFLNIMRRELLKMDDLENWEEYLEQVLYDLYGLKLGVSAWGVQDHGCPPETLQKPRTMQLVERVMILANRMSMKDLLKSDLKTTIDHMQQTIGQLKSSAQMIHNLRNFTEYLKKPIHPLRLYRALSGSVDLDAVSIPPRSDALLANHGWFFLLGMIALTKFKGVDLNRRQTPGATDDLRIGATFLRLQLQFTPDKWDTWLRLAECFDYELDEAVLWTADKINKDRAELVKFQRHAIHCYTLALSHSFNVDVEAYEGDPLHDLYHKFGMRMYASSREPFAMEPFQHSEQERFFIEAMGNGTFKRIVHVEMTRYKVWKYAARLFKMAMKRQPANWKNPYMLAKCYWKMFTADSAELDKTDRGHRINAHAVLNMLKKSVEVAYKARKSRSSEPILEPHYKIVSVLHKMVVRGDLPSKEASSILSAQPFGVSVNEDDHFASFSEPEDWEEYVIRNLSKLRDKDKSNWQHRITMRHASILFQPSSANPDGDAYVEAKAAFSILRESMFTKTMVMNVWKCDAERPGRHHVYTERYTRFMTRLLVIMSDRTNMEQLLRRIRKKGADFYHFYDLWHTCCLAFVKLLRQTYEVPDSTEEVFKAMSPEEFEIITDRITELAAQDGPDTSVFSCMKEAIELKKLNASLTRAGPIDDLINDCYSKIYLNVGDSLPGVEPAKIIEERNKAKETAAEVGTPAEGEVKPSNPLQSLLNPPEGQDSRRTTPTPQDSEKPEAGARPRRAGIRRPDVLRKAEQAVMRSMEPRVGAPKSRLGSMSSGKRGSQTPVAAMSDDGIDSEGPDAQVRREAGEGMDVDMKDTNGEGPREDLVSDGESLGENDGDEESDLSDVPEGSDEEMPPGLMFPNLQREDTNAETSGEEADSESAGDETGTEEDDGELNEDGEREEAAEEGGEEGEEEGEGDGDLEMADAEVVAEEGGEETHAEEVVAEPEEE